MTSPEDLKITAESTIFMNTRSDEELFAAEHHVLDMCKDGHVFDEKELLRYEALIISLVDSAYVTERMNKDNNALYITTEAGKQYDKRIVEHLSS